MAKYGWRGGGVIIYFKIKPSPPPITTASNHATKLIMAQTEEFLSQIRHRNIFQVLLCFLIFDGLSPLPLYSLLGLENSRYMKEMCGKYDGNMKKYVGNMWKI